jgi:hypothetical protein
MRWRILHSDLPLLVWMDQSTFGAFDCPHHLDLPGSLLAPSCCSTRSSTTWAMPTRSMLRQYLQEMTSSDPALVLDSLCFASVLYRNLGVDWASSTLGFLSSAFIPIPCVLYFYGERIRKASKRARRAL